MFAEKLGLAFLSLGLVTVVVITVFLVKEAILSTLNKGKK